MVNHSWFGSSKGCKAKTCINLLMFRKYVIIIDMKLFVQVLRLLYILYLVVDDVIVDRERNRIT